MSKGCHVNQHSLQRSLPLCRGSAFTTKTLSFFPIMMTTIFPTRRVKAWLTHNFLEPTVTQMRSVANVTGSINTRLVVGIGATAVGLGALALARKWYKERHTFQYIEDVFSTDCGLATDHLEEGYGDEDGFELDENPDMEDYQDRHERGGDEPKIIADEARDGTSIRGVAKLSHSPVEVSTHRRIRWGRGMKYMNCVLSECKNKFGTPTQNEANNKAIMRYANNIMTKHGLRPSHVRRYLPMIVSMTFVPSKEELEALAMLNSAGANYRKVDYLFGSLGAGLTNVN